MSRRIFLLRVPVDKVAKQELISFLLDNSKHGKRKTVSYSNPNNINIALADEGYRHALERMDLIYPDGIGVVWASMVLGMPLKERVHIFDFFDEFANKAKEIGLRLYLLGAEEAIVERAAKHLREKYALEIVGYHHGYFDETENQRMIDEINRFKPNMLIVGMGVPKQEKWIMNNLEKLEVNVCWAVGGAINTWVGELACPPRIVRMIGLQWLFRLCQEPRRLWRRYLVGIPIFIYRVVRERCRLARSK